MWVLYPIHCRWLWVLEWLQRRQVYNQHSLLFRILHHFLDSVINCYLKNKRKSFYLVWNLSWGCCLTCWRQIWLFWCTGKCLRIWCLKTMKKPFREYQLYFQPHTLLLSSLHEACAISLQTVQRNLSSLNLCVVFKHSNKITLYWNTGQHLKPYVQNSPSWFIFCCYSVWNRIEVSDPKENELPLWLCCLHT